jgi:hypothetical protein
MELGKWAESKGFHSGRAVSRPDRLFGQKQNRCTLLHESIRKKLD